MQDALKTINCNYNYCKIKDGYSSPKLMIFSWVKWEARAARPKSTIESEQVEWFVIMGYIKKLRWVDHKCLWMSF